MLEWEREGDGERERWGGGGGGRETQTYLEFGCNVKTRWAAPYVKPRLARYFLRQNKCKNY